MKILDRLPYHEKPTLLSFRDGAVDIRAYQIVVWVRLRNFVFPSVLDTGHSHNFSIPERLLKDWAGVESLEPIGEIEVNRQRSTQYRADVWIHRNCPGRREPTDLAFQLEIEQGITVVSDGMPNAPRLPLLGLRAISRNRLRLTIDGSRRQVSLSAAGWLSKWV
jgi:hypothetical protein